MLNYMDLLLKAVVVDRLAKEAVVAKKNSPLGIALGSSYEYVLLLETSRNQRLIINGDR